MFPDKKNLAVGWVDAAVNTTQTSLTFAEGKTWSGLGFPGYQYYPFVTLSPKGALPNSLNSEIVKVTSASGGTFSFTRAQRGTTKKSFPNGCIVTNGVYAEDLSVWRQIPVTANIPNASWDWISGLDYYPTFKAYRFYVSINWPASYKRLIGVDVSDSNCISDFTGIVNGANTGAEWNFPSGGNWATAMNAFQSASCLGWVMKGYLIPVTWNNGHRWGLDMDYRILGSANFGHINAWFAYNGGGKNDAYHSLPPTVWLGGAGGASSTGSVEALLVEGTNGQI